MTKRIQVVKFKYVAKAREKFSASRNFHISAGGKRVGQIVFNRNADKYFASFRVITRKAAAIGWDWVTLAHPTDTPEELMAWLDSKANVICNKYELTNGRYKNEELNFLARCQRIG